MTHFIRLFVGAALCPFVGVAIATVSLVAPSSAVFAQQILQQGATATFTSEGTPEPVDYVNGKAMKLPVASAYTDQRSRDDVVKALSSPPALHQGSKAFPGAVGSGQQSVATLGSPAKGAPGTENKEAGTSNLPFSSARADFESVPTNNIYPYRAAGKLFFLIGNDTYVCSASLVKKGLAVTAAHCVAAFGMKQYYHGWQFVPGYRNGDAPYGTWAVSKIHILGSYFDGTDECAQRGVVCRNDVAILTLEPKQGADGKPYYPGANTGWFAYGLDSWGYTGRGITHVTQLGYPLCLDDGALMERNDAQGVVSSDFSDNTVIGSLMCGGSSGGPWIVNFGIRPSLSGTSPGTASQANQIVGVSSWGSTDAAVKQMGASPFTAANVGILVAEACASHPDACKD